MVMTEPYRIRRATPADAAALADISRTSFVETFVDEFAIPYHPDDLEAFLAENHSTEAFAEWLAEPGVTAWVAEAGGEAAGYALVGPVGVPHPDVAAGDLELHRLYLPRAHHGSGAGGLLMQAALDGMCAGMPLTSVRVVSADLAVNRALSAGFAASRNYNDVVVLRSRVFVSSTADQVTMGDTLTAQDSANGAAASLSSASGRVVAGRVGLAIDWAVSCSDYPSPPQVRLTLTSHNATFPGRASLTDETLAQAFLAACPTRTRQDLSDAGWPLPGS